MSYLTKMATASLCLALAIALIQTTTTSASVTSSDLESAALFAAPLPPTYYSPANGATGLGQTVDLMWNNGVGATRFNVQVARDAAFTKMVYHTNVPHSPAHFTAPVPGATYYWRVNSSNADGTSKWGAVWSFTTTAPVLSTPILVSPANGATGVALSTNLTFKLVPNATRYNVQVSTNPSFTAIVYKANVPKSPVMFNAPAAGTYYWRVQASTEIVKSKFSAGRSFTTVAAAPSTETVSSFDAIETLPSSFALHENYPNPFNPSTTIMIDVPEATNLKLAVYDLLGQEIKVLESGTVEAGRHTYSFDASGLASGIYLYRLESATYAQTNRMLLLK